MGKRKITFIEECEIVFQLFQKRRIKLIQKDYNLSRSRISQIKRSWPLFFWNHPRIRKIYLDVSSRWWFN